MMSRRTIPRSVLSRRSRRRGEGYRRSVGLSSAATPARAANALVLPGSPVNIVYLIDGSSRKIKVGNQIIQFKHAGPRALLGAVHPRVLLCRLFVRSGLTTSRIALSGSFGKICHQRQRQD